MMGAAQATPDPEASGLFGLAGGGGVNASRFMRGLRLHLSGWVNAGISYNPSNPGNGFNGPITFTDRAGEFQLNQFYLSLERPVDAQGGHWDFGGRVDALFGTDAVFTQANGDPRGHWDQRLLGNDLRFYQLALPQAYLETVTPVGKGIRIRGGHFYTILGNESVMAPDNFFASHSYLMQYGEPFTHTGFLASYAPTDTLVLNAGAVTGGEAGGWDGGFDRNLDVWGFLGGLSWANADGDSTLSANAAHGGIKGRADADLNLYSLVLHHDFSEAWHYTIQHDYGWIDTNGPKAAEWYGIVHYLTYAWNDEWELGLRAEWFRDDDGSRVAAASRIALHPTAAGQGGSSAVYPMDSEGRTVGASFYAITLGVSWKPATWLTVRPNLRYDRSDGARMFDCGGSRCGSGSQWLLSTDLVLVF